MPDPFGYLPDVTEGRDDWAEWEAMMAADEPAVARFARLVGRESLPARRKGYTQKARVGGHKI